MKIKIAAALLVVAIALAALFYDQGQRPNSYRAPRPVAVAAPAAPDLRFTTLDGQTLALADLREPVVVLHFWASWCAPCLTEFPGLLARAGADGGRLAVVAISIDDDEAAMRRFVARQTLPPGAHVYWVWDRDKSLSLRYFDTVRVPESVLVGRDRRTGNSTMVDKLAGDPGWMSPAMAQTLAGLETR